MLKFARGLSLERGMQDLHGVTGGEAGAVFDLVAAAGARRGNQCSGGRRAQGGEEHQLADLHRQPEVLGFVAEGAGHPAATAGDGLDRVVTRQAQGSDAAAGPDQGFLKAVSVQFDVLGGVGKCVGGDASRLGFARDKVVDQQAMRRERLSRGFEGGFGEVECFVAKG